MSAAFSSSTGRLATRGTNCRGTAGALGIAGIKFRALLKILRQVDWKKWRDEGNGPFLRLCRFGGQGVGRALRKERCLKRVRRTFDEAFKRDAVVLLLKGERKVKQLVQFCAFRRTTTA